MKPRHIPSALLFVAMSIFCASGMAAVMPNTLFSPHAVLQRDVPIPVWGKAAPGENVTVEFAGQKKSAVAGPDGKWSVTLDPLPACAEGRTLTVSGDQTPAPFVADDILVGEVWLCAGQSNMEYALERCVGGKEAAAASDNPLLRLALVPHNIQPTPQDTAPVKWQPSSPKAAKLYSAVAWWFGSGLQKELGVPVGIIDSSFGGTNMEAWLSLETLRAGPWPQDKRSVPELAKADYDRKVAEAKPDMEKWEVDRAAALKSGQPEPPKPKAWPGDQLRGPSSIWNGMAAPILPFAVRGVAWYQGENNAHPGIAENYYAMLPALISEWRKTSGHPDLPFVIFQLAAFRKPQVDPNAPSGIAVLREAQEQTARKTSNARLVVTMDLGGEDVHYLNKKPAADRALAAALSLAYGKKEDSKSPAFEGVTLRGQEAVVTFTSPDGLDARGGPLEGFVIAGEDRNFVFADARIEGNTVVVSSPQVKKPVAVRYAWADLPKANLVSKQGLPASSFRTDDWPTILPAAKAAKPAEPRE